MATQTTHNIEYAMKATGIEKLQSQLDTLNTSVTAGANKVIAWNVAWDVIKVGAEKALDAIYYGLEKIKEGSLKVIEEYKNFEQAAFSVGLVSGQSFQETFDMIKQIDPALGDATTLTRGLSDIMQSGMTDASKAMDLLVTSSKLAKVSNADLSMILQGMIPILTNFGGSFKTTADAADLFLRANNAAIGGMDNLIKGLGSSAQFAEQLGISIQELAGTYAYLSVKSGDGAQAGTQLTAVLKGLKTPTKEMEAEIAKLSAGSLELSLKNKGLVSTLEELYKNSGLTVLEFTNLLGRMENMLGVGALLSGNLEGVKRTINEVATSTISLNEEWDKWKLTMLAVYDTFVNSIKLIAVEIGTSWAPDIKQAIKEVTQYILDNQESIIQWGKDFGKAIVEVWNMLKQFVADSGLTLPKILDFLIAGVKNFQALITGILGINKEFHSAWGNTFNYIGLVINAVIDTVRVLWNSLEILIKIVIALGAAFTGNFDIAGEAIKDIGKDWQEMGEAFGVTTAKAVSHVTSLSEAGRTEIGKVFKSVEDDYSAMIESMRSNPVTLEADTTKMTAEIKSFYDSTKAMIYALNQEKIDIDNSPAKVKLDELDIRIKETEQNIIKLTNIAIDLNNEGAMDKFEAMKKEVGKYEQQLRALKLERVDLDTSAVTGKIDEINEKILQLKTGFDNFNVTQKLDINTEPAKQAISGFSQEIQGLIAQAKIAKENLDFAVNTGKSQTEIDALSAKFQDLTLTLSQKVSIDLDTSAATKDLDTIKQKQEDIDKSLHQKRMLEIETQKAELGLEKVKKDLTDPGWDKATSKSLTININQPKTSIEVITDMLKTIPDIINKLMQLDNAPFMGAARESKEAIFAIPEEILRKLKLENDQFENQIIDSKNNTSTGLAAIPEDTIKGLGLDNKPALKAIADLMSALTAIVIPRPTLDINNDPAMRAIKEVNEFKIDDKVINIVVKTGQVAPAVDYVINELNRLTDKTVNVTVKTYTENSPRKSFTEGMNFVFTTFEKLQKLSGQVVDMTFKNVGRGITSAVMPTDNDYSDGGERQLGRTPQQNTWQERPATSYGKYAQNSIGMGNVAAPITVHIYNDFGESVKGKDADDIARVVSKKIADDIKTGRSDIPRNLKKYSMVTV